MASTDINGNLRPAVFLDRDGTINVEKEYLYRIEDFEFISGAPAAIKKLKDAGYLVIVVTNQSGVARGYYSLDDVDHLHVHIQNELYQHGTSVDAFYICPHHPTEGTGEYRQECGCRKPNPGMLLKAVADFNIDLGKSFIIGDKIADVDAGVKAGCIPIMVLSGHGQRDSLKLTDDKIFVCENISAAVSRILS